MKSKITSFSETRLDPVHTGHKLFDYGKYGIANQSGLPPELVPIDDIQIASLDNLVGCILTDEV